MIGSLFDRLKLRPRAVATPRPRGTRGEPLRDNGCERPGNWVADNELADALVRDGNTDDAVAQLCALGDRLAADGFVAKAHAIYKKALRLQPANAHAARRVAELAVERINQSGSRLPCRVDEARTLDTDESLLSADVEEPTAIGAATAETAERADALAAQRADIPLGPIADADVAADEHSAPLKAVAEILQDASVTASYGDVSAAIAAVTDCARAHPDLVEPVSVLIEIARRNGLDDVLANAEARLCELYCRRDEYEAARGVAEALVMRHPNDQRHRARLSFVEAAIEERREHAAAAMPDRSPAATETAGATDAPATSEQHPFDACRERARIEVAAGDWKAALGWLERAAATIPDSAAETELAYDIARVLESAGDRDRAVGVFSEIAAQAGANYRDVAERIRRLTATGPGRAAGAPLVPTCV